MTNKSDVQFLILKIRGNKVQMYRNSQSVRGNVLCKAKLLVILFEFIEYNVELIGLCDNYSSGTNFPPIVWVLQVRNYLFIYLFIYFMVIVFWRSSGGKYTKAECWMHISIF